MENKGSNKKTRDFTSDDRKIYDNVKDFMNQDFDVIKSKLMSLTDPAYIGVIKQLELCTDKDELKAVLLEHFSMYIVPLFNLGYIRHHTGFSQDLCVLKDTWLHKFGYINEDLEYDIPAIYDSAYPFNKMYLAIVEFKGRLGVINNSGTWVIEPNYTEILVDENCFNYTCNDGSDIYCYTLDLRDHIMSEPEELNRFYVSK